MKLEICRTEDITAAVISKDFGFYFPVSVSDPVAGKSARFAAVPDPVAGKSARFAPRSHVPTSTFPSPSRHQSFKPSLAEKSQPVYTKRTNVCFILFGK